MDDDDGARPSSPARGAQVARWIAWTTLGAIVSTLELSVALGADAVGFAVLALPFPVVGTVVAARRPRTRSAGSCLRSAPWRRSRRP